MNARETRKNLINELNIQFSGIQSSFDVQKTSDIDLNSYKKPKMFVPKDIQIDNGTVGQKFMSDIPAVNGIGFKKDFENTPKKKAVQEIYSMQELINSNPESMRTLSINPKEVKAQLALVKRRDWQELLFEDVDWFKSIDLSYGFKKLFRL